MYFLSDKTFLITLPLYEKTNKSRFQNTGRLLENLLPTNHSCFPLWGKQEYVIKKRQDGENKKPRGQVKFEKTKI